MELTREERQALAKTLKRYIKNSTYEPFTKEGLRRVVDDFEYYGRPDDMKEFKLLKDLVDEALGFTGGPE